jgi:hypothetical protein
LSLPLAFLSFLVESDLARTAGTADGLTDADADGLTVADARVAHVSFSANTRDRIAT